MSEPKRYYLDDYGVLIEHPAGEYVLHSDYARLKAEVERLTWLQVETLNERNKAEAEVERLRKAGDMCDQLLACFEMEGRKGVNIGRDMWNAAKEGKQS